MPISITEFMKLPKVELGSRKGGKKVNWENVQKDISGHGAFTAKEVFGLAVKHAIVKPEIDPKTGEVKDPISKFRVQRWLTQMIEKGVMECKIGPNGEYVYAVSVIGKIDTPKAPVGPSSGSSVSGTASPALNKPVVSGPHQQNPQNPPNQQRDISK